MIFKNELYKLTHTRMFLFILTCVLLMNIYVSYSQNFGLRCSDSEYKEYYEHVESMSFEDAYDYTMDQRDNVYLGWENGMWEIRSMLSAQLEQLEAVAAYKDYLQSIDDTAATMTAVSIFADPHSFAYRNIVMTPPAYDRVRSVHPVFAPSNGVLLAAENIPSDLLMLFLIFTAVTVIFYKDRESGITGLIKPLRYGRTRLALAKTDAVFTVCFVTEAVIFAMNLVIGSSRYGLGDLSRPIQSLEGYLGCNLRISVLQFLWLTFLVKLVALFLCALIAQTLFIRLKNVTAYLSIIVVAGVETALYLLIGGTSAFSVFKQINLAAFVNASHLFVTYQNINFFSLPISLIITTLVSIGALTAVFIALTVKLYSNISISEIKKTYRFRIRRKVPRGLFGYAVYKEFVMHKGALILIAALAFQVYSAYNYVRPYNVRDNYYRAYTSAAYELSSTEEVAAYIAAEKESLDKGYQAAMSGQYVDNEYLTKVGAFERFTEQYDNAVEVSGGRDVQRYMYYLTGYEEIFGVHSVRQDYVLGLIAVLGICIAVAPLIAYDNRARIGFLLYTTKAGRSRYFRHNAAVAAIFASLISIVVYIPYYVQILRAYGTVGIFEPVSAISAYSRLSGLSVLGYLILLTLLRTLVLIAFSEFTLFVSYKSKSPTTATIVMLAIFALPIVIYLVGAEFMQWLCLPISGNREILSILS